MFACEELAGKLHVSDTYRTHNPKTYTIGLTGRQVFELQNLLEEIVTRGGNYQLARIAVLLGEAIRVQVADAQLDEEER